MPPCVDPLIHGQIGVEDSRATCIRATYTWVAYVGTQPRARGALGRFDSVTRNRFHCIREKPRSHLRTEAGATLIRS
jgi:hypothetical protein